MKRTNDIITTFVENQRRSGYDEKMFMALQILPKDSEEYRTLSRRLVTSLSSDNPMPQTTVENLVNDVEDNGRTYRGATRYRSDRNGNI